MIQNGLFIKRNLPMMPWYLERHPEDQSLKKKKKMSHELWRKKILTFFFAIQAVKKVLTFRSK